MNSKFLEAGQQKFDYLKHRVSLIAKTFVLGMLGPFGPLMMGCGHVTVAKTFMGRPAEIHDHNGRRVVSLAFSEEDYDQAKHGDIVNFLKEGEALPNMPKGKDGKTAVHRHSSNAHNGPHEYAFE